MTGRQAAAEARAIEREIAEIIMTPGCRLLDGTEPRPITPYREVPPKSEWNKHWRKVFA
jgi:hypothetical protein